MKFTLEFSAAVLAVAEIACGGSTADTSSAPADDGVQTPATADAHVRTFCDAYATKTHKCSKIPAEEAKDDATCRSKDGPCSVKILRPAALAGIGKCLATQACGEIEDVCYVQVARSLPTSPLSDAYVTACSQKVAECGRNTNSFSDDWCANSELLVDELYGPLQKCFELACGNYTIGKCLNEKRLEMSGGLCSK